MEKVQFYGTGRRKSSVARVRLVAGEGNITVNGRALDEYFDYDTLIRDVKQPLVLTNNENKYDVIVKVEGGGFTGQAGAIRHGISRALLKADAELRSEKESGGHPATAIGFRFLSNWNNSGFAHVSALSSATYIGISPTIDIPFLLAYSFNLCH